MLGMKRIHTLKMHDLVWILWLSYADKAVVVYLSTRRPFEEILEGWSFPFTEFPKRLECLGDAGASGLPSALRLTMHVRG